MTALDFIKDRKLPFSLIERGAGLPKNSLSRIVKGKRKMPRKHEKSVIEFLEGYGFKMVEFDLIKTPEKGGIEKVL